MNHPDRFHTEEGKHKHVVLQELLYDPEPSGSCADLLQVIRALDLKGNGMTRRAELQRILKQMHRARGRSVLAAHEKAKFVAEILLEASR